MKDETSINNFFLSDGQTALPKLTHGSLFSGIGGFDLAAEWAGFENIFHCEWNEFGQKILNYYWPNAISYADITKTDFTIHRGAIDILTGGFPCQPYSTAGKRKGKEDDRHLWPEMLRAIREIQPTYIVGENVLGLISWNGGLVFEEVQTDLEAEGYEVQAFILPACSKNAPHRRERVWFVANRCSDGCDRNKEHSKGQQHIGGGQTFSELNTYVSLGDATNTDSKRLQRREDRHKSQGGQESTNKQFTRCDKLFRQEWKEFPNESPVCDGDDGLSSRLDGITFSKWRQESIKAGGNAIVPQVAYEIFKCISVFERGGKKIINTVE